MDLDQMRRQMDAINDSMLRLFIKRMELSAEMARYKKASGMAIRNIVREADTLRRVTQGMSEPMAGYVRRLFVMLFKDSRDYQRVVLNAEDKEKTE